MVLLPARRAGVELLQGRLSRRLRTGYGREDGYRSFKHGVVGTVHSITTSVGLFCRRCFRKNRIWRPSLKSCPAAPRHFALPLQWQHAQSRAVCHSAIGHAASLLQPGLRRWHGSPQREQRAEMPRVVQVEEAPQPRHLQVDARSGEGERHHCERPRVAVHDPQQRGGIELRRVGYRPRF